MSRTCQVRVVVAERPTPIVDTVDMDKVYEQLHDAMEVLVQICRDGCETIGPHNKPLDEKKQGGCKFVAYKALESLVRIWRRSMFEN